ncbi:PqiC family protein [Sulfurovum sp. zt1-1]|uniref:PqiC family protein n=1 Tax=Sulfurovum zhangzhouensis TaxID=3019067 RepID=A0ABT7QV63_9BACT|nr:PqiC family protein [Sulfurovum zhangzhouensis]MDM5270732.1 PqiC family protein [Sulfurovum zhangzhouensis]
MKKNILITMLVLLMTGCATKSHYYVLSTAMQPSHVTPSTKSIGVAQVILPSYMDKRQLTIASSGNQITQLDSVLWAEDIDIGLTQRLISFLQKKFEQPNVFAYPWGVDRQPDIQVKLQINRFLAQGDKVYLDANYLIIDTKGHTSHAYLFNTTLKTSSEPSAIVNTMDNAFGKLEEDIADKIK